MKPKHGAVFSNITSVYLALMLSLFPLFVGTGGFQSIAGAKYTLFLILCGGYAGGMLLLLLESVLIGQMKLPPLRELLRRSTWPQRFVALYLVFTLISTLLSPYRAEAWLGVSRNEGCLTIVLYCLCFLLVSAFGAVKKWMLWILGGTVTLFSVLSTLQLFGLNPFTLYPEGYNYFGANVHYSGAYLGTIGNVDLAAAFLCVVIPVLWIAVLRLRGKARFFLLIPLALSLFVLCKMSVLAGLVGVFGGAVLALPVVLPAAPKVRKRVGIAVGGAILLALAVLFFADIGSGLFHEIHEILHGRISDTFGSGRIHIWKEVLARVPDRLFFGHGPDTMLNAELPPFTRYDEALGLLLEACIDTAHNEYLNILFHQGIFALICYLAALITGAWQWIRHSGTDAAAAILGGGVLCCCIQAFFGISTCITAPFFWLAFGLLDSRCRETEQGGRKLCGKN